MSTAAASTSAAPRKGLHLGLWVAQVLLGLAFTMAGVMKTTQPIAELGKAMPWVNDLPNLVRFIGLSELLGGIGMILPSATRIQPKLTGFAGVGLVTVMVLAAGFHVMHSEFQALPVNFVLGGLAAFVAWGRLQGAPIAPKGS
jgi:putative oxidoreductase